MDYAIGQRGRRMLTSQFNFSYKKERSLNPLIQDVGIYNSQQGNEAPCWLFTEKYYSCPPISDITWRMAAFCESDKTAHFFSNSVCPGVRDTKSLSEKNWLREMPKASQIVSNVDMLGMVLRWKIFAMVDGGRPDFLASLYSVQPRSSVNSRMCRMTSKIPLPL